MITSRSPENTTEYVDVLNSECLRIVDVASSWGFDVVDVVDDGNLRSFYSSGNLQLKQIMSQNDPHSMLVAHVKEHIGLEQCFSINDVDRILRRKVVEEFKGERVGYLPDGVSILSEADRFGQSGTFSGPVGDLIPFAIANIIQLPIFVLNPSYLYLFPFVMISLEVLVPAFDAVYLAYNRCGPGHYDVLKMSQPKEEQVTRDTDINLQTPENITMSFIWLVKEKIRMARNYKGTCKCINEFGTCMGTCNCCGTCQGKQRGGNDGYHSQDKMCRTPRKLKITKRNAVKAKRSNLSTEENNEEIKDPGFNELEFFSHAFDCLAFQLIFVKNLDYGAANK